jgi:hypothetical protein
MAPRAETFWRLSLVAIAALAVLAWVQAPTPSLYGYDGPYHLGYSAWIRDHGVDHTFPWWQETFLRDHWADKDFLYHLALIPFTFAGLESGGKAASLFFGTLMYLSIGLALRGLGARAPALWVMACLLGSTSLLYRAGLVRSHVAAIALSVIGAAAILRGRRWTAALAAGAYAWTHIAWHLLPAIAVAHAGVSLVLRRRPRWSTVAAVLGATAVAIAANPFFPDSLRLWKVQTIDVLAMSWSPAAPDLDLGHEVLRGSPWELVRNDAGPLAFTALGVALLLRARPWKRSGAAPDDLGDDLDLAAVTLGCVTLGFLGLTLLSRRFVEFWAPFSVLFAASAAAAWPPAPGRLPRWAASGAIVLLAVLGWHNVTQTRRIIADDPGLLFAGCARWIHDHVPAERTVFTTDWDEFPELFYFAPGQRYLVGLDPTFMYVTSPERWRAWRSVAEGSDPALRRRIVDTFGAACAFADAGYETFIERAGQEPGVRLAYADRECRVYEMDPLGDPRLPAPGSISTWRVEQGPPLTVGPGEFVDVRRAVASTTGSTCARLDGSFSSPEERTARFHLFSDDRIQVRLNGTLVYDTDAPRPAPTLDEVVAQHRSGGRQPNERVFQAPLRPGYNDVSLSVCRTGEVWGFILEIEP